MTAANSNSSNIQDYCWRNGWSDQHGHLTLSPKTLCNMQKTRLATANRSRALAFVWQKFRASGVVDL